MRGLAEFIMRGPLQAALVAIAAAAFPLMFWLSAATVGLVALRVGVGQGINLGLWAALPAVAWAWKVHDPSAVIVIVETLVMALVLRLTVSWEKTLVTGAALGLLAAWLVPLVLPDLIQALTQTGVQFYQQFEPQLASKLGDQLAPTVREMLTASMGGSYLAVSVASLALARSWQAKLYNPGGFRAEFHRLRLRGPVALGLLALMLVLVEMKLAGSLAIMVLGLPLLVAGIALVHGVIAGRGLGVQWLVGFYVALFLLGGTLVMVLVLIAFIDSWVDFRKRLRQA